MRIFACLLLTALLPAALLAPGAGAADAFYGGAPERGPRERLLTPNPLPERDWRVIDPYRLRQEESRRRLDRPLGPGDLRRYDLHRHRDLGLHDHRSLLDHDRHFFGAPYGTAPLSLQRSIPRIPGTVCYRSGAVLVCTGR